MPNFLDLFALQAVKVSIELENAFEWFGCEGESEKLCCLGVGGKE